MATMLYIGTFFDVDPDESNITTELAGSWIGEVRDVASGGIKLVSVTSQEPGWTNPYVIGDNDNFGGNSNGDKVVYDVGGGLIVTDIDSTDWVTVNFTDANGAVFSEDVAIIRTIEGHVFLTELFTNPGALDGRSIQSLQITAVPQSGTTGWVHHALNGSGVEYSFDGLTVVCFALGSMIRTEAGEVPVEDLRQGDLVLTADNGYQPIRWIGANKISAAQLDANPKLRPIRIRAGALGPNMPAEDLCVSPQHRMLVRSSIAEKMFDAGEVLVAAKQLVMLDGIDIAHDVADVEYFHFLFDQHEVVFANGAASESLYTGPVALKSVSPKSRREILTLFPELNDIDYKALSARTLVQGRKARQLAVRHKNNRKVLVQEKLH